MITPYYYTLDIFVHVIPYNPFISNILFEKKTHKISVSDKW